MTYFSANDPLTPVTPERSAALPFHEWLLYLSDEISQRSQREIMGGVTPQSVSAMRKLTESVEHCYAVLTDRHYRGCDPIVSAVPVEEVTA